MSELAQEITRLVCAGGFVSVDPSTITVGFSLEVAIHRPTHLRTTEADMVEQDIISMCQRVTALRERVIDAENEMIWKEPEPDGNHS